MTRRPNGYLKAVRYTALLDLRALLAELRARCCRHSWSPMTDPTACALCGTPRKDWT